jgi:predicted permease
MKILRRFLKRLVASTMRRHDDERLNEEIDEHLALQTEENLRAGLSPEEARRQAVLKFGALEAIKEEYRERRTLPAIDTLLQDTRQALRRLRKSPGFTITCILTLALGIGATTSIFSLVYAVLLKSLPVANPDQLYRLGKDPHCCVSIGFVQSGEFGLVSNALYEYFRDNTKAFEQLAAFDAGGTFLGVRRAKSTYASETEFGEFVSGNYFAMFGIDAYAGRALSKTDDTPVAIPAAVMSYRLWKQKYSLDSSVIGGVFNINDRPFTIVGVTPPSFYGDRLSNRPPDFYLPLATEPLLRGESSLLKKADTHWLNVIGRINTGTNVASTEAQMRVELQEWLRSHWGEMNANERSSLSRQTLNLGPGGSGITSMRQQYGSWLRILIMVAAFVLLIVCANVANLMLVRAMERRQQTSVSMALGARPIRIVQPILTESIILSLVGGAVSLAVAFAGTRLILHFAFETNSSVPVSAAPSGPALAFAFVLSLVTGVLFGMAPAWLAIHVNPIEALRGANRSTRDAGSLPRKALVVLQAGLSVVLLSASWLLVQTLRNLENQDLGFAQDRRIVINIDPLLAGYKPGQLEPLYERIHDSLAALPGVVSVAAALYTPQSGDDWGEGVYVEGKPAPGPNTDNGAGWSRVSSGFFATMGTPIVRGRPLNDQDTARSRHVAVVNEGFARKFFKKEDPLGKHFGKGGTIYAGDYEVVGVAKDARFANYNLDQPVAAFFFLPEAQSSQYIESGAASTELRSHYLHDVVAYLQPGATLPDAVVRRTLASVDPNLPVRRIQNLEQQVASTFSQQRLISRLTSLFGILALVLASIGLYGVTSYNVGRRVNEIGVRMALGADRGQILALVLREAFLLIAFGLLVGIPLALVTGRFLGNQLYGVSQHDPIALAIAVITLAVCAFIATIFPAFRASSISPLNALRVD